MNKVTIVLISIWKEGTRPTLFRKAIKRVGNVEATKTILKLSPIFNCFPVIIERTFANKVDNRVYMNVRNKLINQTMTKVRICKVPPND